MIWCRVCDRFHSFLANCPALRVGFERAVQRTTQEDAPLPPTAEQTSIARFNALADQIRANQAESLKFYGSFMNMFEVLVHKIDRLALDEKIGYDAVMRMLARPNVAVAKKKAAPLVGKRKLR